MELLQEISTEKSKPGDFFDLRVPKPVLINNRTAIPAGARAVGQVIDSQEAGIFGNPAKLLITIRYVDLGAQRIALRLYQPSQGTDRTIEAMVMGVIPFVSLVSPFIQGGQIILPIGTQLIAKVSKDSFIQVLPRSPSVDPVTGPILGETNGTPTHSSGEPRNSARHGHPPNCTGS
jgi:hypothetical protein